MGQKTSRVPQLVGMPVSFGRKKDCRSVGGGHAGLWRGNPSRDEWVELFQGSCAPGDEMHGEQTREGLAAGIRWATIAYMWRGGKGAMLKAPF